VQSVALQQYEYGRKVLEGTIADPGFLMVWREPKVNVDELSDVKVRAKALAHANPEPWKRLDDLERRFHEVPLHEFCRYHLNMWVEPDAERWLPPGVWDGLAAGGLPEDGTKIVLGFDGSYSGDSTALVGATVAEQPHLFVLGLWEHPGGSQGWQVDIDQVDATVLEAFSRFDVAGDVGGPSVLGAADPAVGGAVRGGPGAGVQHVRSQAHGRCRLKLLPGGDAGRADTRRARGAGTAHRQRCPERDGAGGVHREGRQVVTSEDRRGYRSCHRV
jgi:hypothetical protein